VLLLIVEEELIAVEQKEAPVFADHIWWDMSIASKYRWLIYLMLGRCTGKNGGISDRWFSTSYISCTKPVYNRDLYYNIVALSTCFNENRFISMWNIRYSLGASCYCGFLPFLLNVIVIN
jgi:hypothetical protein